MKQLALPRAGAGAAGEGIVTRFRWRGVRTSRPSGILLAKENPMRTEQQKEAWAGVLLTALVAGMILGAWLVLRLTTT